MAGPHGPSRGRNHPHYIGVITMDESTMALNDPVFAGLSDLIAGGNNVVVPIFKDTDVSATGYKLSLGTGIGATQPNWGAIQKYILVHLVALGAAAAAVDIADGTYWPDLRTQPPKLYPVASLADLEDIVDTVLS
jgi:hypothetical protein